jgi:hypothetical protein
MSDYEDDYMDSMSINASYDLRETLAFLTRRFYGYKYTDTLLDEMVEGVTSGERSEDEKSQFSELITEIKALHSIMQDELLWTLALITEIAKERFMR